MGIDPHREIDITMPRQCLRHLGSDSSTCEVGDERMSIRMEIRESTLTILIREKIGLRALHFFLPMRNRLNRAALYLLFVTDSQRKSCVHVSVESHGIDKPSNLLFVRNNRLCLV